MFRIQHISLLFPSKMSPNYAKKRRPIKWPLKCLQMTCAGLKISVERAGEIKLDCRNTTTACLSTAGLGESETTARVTSSYDTVSCVVSNLSLLRCFLRCMPMSFLITLSHIYHLNYDGLTIQLKCLQAGGGVITSAN